MKTAHYYSQSIKHGYWPAKFLATWVLLFPLLVQSQTLKLKPRKEKAIGGAAFARSIAGADISLADREELICREVLSGNVPQSCRKLIRVSDTILVSGGITTIHYYVLPDYLAVGSDTDYFYCPLTPETANRIAKKLRCSLPTKNLVDLIYRNASVKLVPQPIPPTPKMTTVPVFMVHNQLVVNQRDSIYANTMGKLVAGNKKDVIQSRDSNHVWIYGWHKPDGKAIQPVYGKHEATWADYSHGIRLIQNRVWINGKKMRLEDTYQLY